MSRLFLHALLCLTLFAGTAVLLVDRPIDLQAQQRTLRLLHSGYKLRN